MKIVIVGAGRVGYAIAEQLLTEGHDITVVEGDPERAAYISSTLDVIVVEGRANVDQLRIANVADADLLIAATTSDETNLISCMVGRKLGATHTIARVRDEEYYQDVVLLQDELGLSLSINPERTSAKEISRTLRFPAATKVEPFANGLVELVEFKLREGSKLDGLRLNDFRSRYSEGILICAVEREGSVTIPNGDFVLAAGDYVTVVGAPHELHELFRKIGEFRHEAESVIIVGGGYIGLELAEACILQKIPEIHIVEALDRLLNVFDPEFSEMVKAELEKNGVHIHLGERVMSFEGEDDKVTAVKTDKDCYAADVVILSIGVSPNTRFLPEGIEKLGNGALVTDASMKTSVPDVYAAGDCASVWSKLLDKPMYIALGTNANKQGRLAGDAVLGKNVRFARALGTSMLRVMGMEFAKTGLGEQECKANGIDYKTTTVESRSHARYYPDPVTLTVKLTYRAADKVLLGAQIAGAKEAAVRIDTFACAVDQGMTTDELGFLDLGYAPPFASVWDAIAIAANASK